MAKGTSELAYFHNDNSWIEEQINNTPHPGVRNAEQLLEISRKEDLSSQCTVVVEHGPTSGRKISVAVSGEIVLRRTTASD